MAAEFPQPGGDVDEPDGLVPPPGALSCRPPARAPVLAQQRRPERQQNRYEARVRCLPCCKRSRVSAARARCVRRPHTTAE